MMTFSVLKSTRQTANLLTGKAVPADHDDHDDLPPWVPGHVCQKQSLPLSKMCIYAYPRLQLFQFPTAMPPCRESAVSHEASERRDFSRKCQHVLSLLRTMQHPRHMKEVGNVSALVAWPAYSEDSR